jgi:hypothetical protein
MALLKRLLRRRNAAAAAAGPGPGPGPGSGAGAAPRLPRLKVVLMSATLDAALYSGYFGGCPGELPGGMERRGNAPCDSAAAGGALRCARSCPLAKVSMPFALDPAPKPPPTPPLLPPQSFRARGAPSRWSGCSWRTCTRRRATAWTPGRGGQQPLEGTGPTWCSARLPAGCLAAGAGGAAAGGSSSAHALRFPLASHTRDRAALRAGGPGGAARGVKAAAKGDARRAGLLRAGWGDDEADAGPVNPYYDPDRYQDYSVVTRR